MYCLVSLTSFLDFVQVFFWVILTSLHISIWLSRLNTTLDRTCDPQYLFTTFYWLFKWFHMSTWVAYTLLFVIHDSSLISLSVYCTLLVLWFPFMKKRCFLLAFLWSFVFMWIYLNMWTEGKARYWEANPIEGLFFWQLRSGNVSGQWTSETRLPVPYGGSRAGVRCRWTVSFSVRCLLPSVQVWGKKLLLTLLSSIKEFWWESLHKDFGYTLIWQST